MKALSLFNGISALHLALDKAEIKVSQVYYAEIDKYANKITEKHYPNDVALGDVTKWREWNIDWADIGLVGAGFPCQAWSVAGKQLGDKDERGMLFWTTLEIIAHVLKHNPEAKFLMENVKMKKEFEEYITHHTEQALGHVEKTLINSALVSAQNRQRYYWTNFEVTQPDDKGILLRDIIEGEPDASFNINPQALKRYTSELGKVKGFKSINDKSNCLTASMHKGFGNDGCTVVCGATYNRKDGLGKELDKSLTICAGDWRGLNRNQNQTAIVFHPASIVGRQLVFSVNDNDRVSSITENERGFRPHQADIAKSGISELGRILKPNSKTDTLTTSHPPKMAINNEISNLKYRKLTPVECERLQTFPDNWTDCVSNTQRYKALGNAWTVDVIVHILKCAFN